MPRGKRQSSQSWAFFDRLSNSSPAVRRFSEGRRWFLDTRSRRHGRGLVDLTRSSTRPQSP